MSQFQINFEKSSSTTPEALAEALGAEIVPAAVEGWALVKLPEGVGLEEAMRRARSFDGVRTHYDSLMFGTGLGSSSRDAEIGAQLSGARPAPVEMPALGDLQWQFGDSDFLPDSWTRAAATGGDAPVIVAIIDSGVSDAPSIRCAERVAGWDFVDGDGDPSDEHGHGTHIASLIFADPSCGALTMGYAPGVSLMPVRALDADLVGTEFALAESILYAVEHGADVINMSLSFGKGYAPGAMLQAAIHKAASRDVVMVGSTGNDGAEHVGWPAASPQVIAVGAYAAHTLDEDAPSRTWYSNYGAGVDVLAPGGDNQDHDGDGMPDGMLGEAPVRGADGQYDYFFSAGTSQAAAAVTGLAALMLSREIPAEQVPSIITASAFRPSGADEHIGAGLLSPGNALSFLDRADYPGDEALAARFQVSHVLGLSVSADGPAVEVKITARMSHPTKGSVSLADAGVTDAVYILGHWTGVLDGTDGCEILPGEDSCAFSLGLDKTLAGLLAGFEIDAVGVRGEGAGLLDGWSRPAEGFYGVEAEWAEAMKLDGEAKVVLFHQDPESEAMSSLFPELTMAEAWLYRPLGATGAMAPSAWLMDSAFHGAIFDGEGLAEGNGLGSSSRVFEFGAALFMPALPVLEAAPEQAQGNGLGSSSLDFEAVMGLGSSSLIFTGHDQIGYMVAQGNGLGSSSLDFEAVMGLGSSSNVFQDYTNLFQPSAGAWSAVGNGLGSSSHIGEGGFLLGAQSGLLDQLGGLSGFYGGLNTVAHGNGLGSSSHVGDHSAVMGLGSSSHIAQLIYDLYASEAVVSAQGNGLGSSSLDFEAVMGLGSSSHIDELFTLLFQPQAAGNGLGSSSLDFEAVMGLGSSSNVTQIGHILQAGQMVGNGLGSSSLDFEAVMGLGSSSHINALHPVSVGVAH